MASIFGGGNAKAASNTAEVSQLFKDYFGDPSIYGKKTVAGATVSGTTCLTNSTYFRCIDNIASDLAKLPLVVYESDSPDGAKKTILPKHPVQSLLNKPNADMTSFKFRQTVNSWYLGWGNGVSEIETTYGGKPLAAYPIHPARVSPTQRNSRFCYDVRGAMTGKTTLLTTDEVLHFSGMGDGIWGYSVFRLAAETIGLALGAEAFGASLFGNSAHPHGVFKHPGKLSDTARKHLKESILEKYTNPTQANKPLLLEEGLLWEATSIPPEDAQFLETRQFSVEEVCRWFRMPPHKVQHLLRSTFSNIESQAIEYVTDTLLTHAVMIEQELKDKLVPDEPNTYIKHNFKSLLRGDTAALSALFTVLHTTGAYSADMILMALDENPLPPGGGGDKHFVQMNLQDLSKAGTTPAPSAFPAKPIPEKAPASPAPIKEDTKEEDTKIETE